MCLEQNETGMQCNTGSDGVAVTHVMNDSRINCCPSKPGCFLCNISTVTHILLG